MLLNLFIKNFILIKQLDLEFPQNGLTVVTGETGAGKSILLDALIFCLAGKIDSQPNDADPVIVSAEFALSDETKFFLEEQAIVVDGDSVIVKRQQHNGRKKFFIADQPVTPKLIQEFAELLLEIHGQHTQTLLTKPSYHLTILDEYAGNKELLSIMSAEYKLLKSQQAALTAFDAAQEKIAQEINYLEHLVDELTKIATYETEEKELTEQQILIKEYKKNIEHINTLTNLLQPDSLQSSLISAQKYIARHFSEKLEKMYQALEEAYIALDTADSEFSSFKANIANLEDSDAIEDRLYLLRELARKYRIQPSELPNLLQESTKRLAELTTNIKNHSELKAAKEAQYNKCIILAQRLSQKRSDAAKKLESKLKQELALLQMADAELVIEIISSNDNLSALGTDTVRFLIKTNQGSISSPLDKIASGGELSRFMLAMKVVLLAKGSKQSIIFDEIDTGIGGSAATSVGDRLRQLGQSAQVITITHQPQVAAFAEHHLQVSKTISTGVTTTSVGSLTAEESLHEIARMLSGKQITEKSLHAAAELIEQARNKP